MHSKVYQGAKQGFQGLVQLTQSKSAELKAIGKIASIATVIMQTATAAMNIYAGFSVIPFIGHALGIAGAAAAIAFGAEQVGTITAAAHGGLMTGGVPGRDSIHTLTMPGELIVPTKNFEEVVNSVADSRNGGGAGPGQNVHVQIGLTRDASRVITAQQIEDEALGLSRVG